MDISAIQQALKARSYDPGEIDGIWGRMTIAAVKHFQTDHGLEPDGVVGPLTSQALIGQPAPAPSRTDTTALVWYNEAVRLMGTREVSGNGSNKAILDWAADLDIHYPNDDIPWCGLFVAHCIGATLTNEVLPTNPLGARNWITFGSPTQPSLGAVLVFWRESQSSGKGHVGFYHGEDTGAYHVLGGNQSDSVSIARVGKNRLLGARQPVSVPPLPGIRVQRTTSGELSQRES